MLENIKNFFVQWYGPDNPQQKWIILLTVLAFFWFPRSSRRLAGVLFIVACVSWFVAHWVMAAYRQYTPQDGHVMATPRRTAPLPLAGPLPGGRPRSA